MNAEEIKKISLRIRENRIQLKLPREELGKIMQMHPIEAIAFEDGNFSNLNGDHLLLAAHFLRMDYRRLLFDAWAQEREPVLDLLRTNSDLSPFDRLAIQEFVQMAENKRMLETLLGLPLREPMRYFFDLPTNNQDATEQAAYAAARERERLGISDQPLNVFQLLSLTGVNVFRHRLEDQRISSLFFRHPGAGSCLLINRVEDHYRERFSAAHAYAHVLLDTEPSIHLSRSGVGGDRREQRANIFAGHLLIPPSAFQGIDRTALKDPDRVVALCLELGDRFLVNGMAILLRFLEMNWLQPERMAEFMNRPELRSELHPPFDPVLPFRLPSAKKKNFQPLLDRGVSWEYLALVIRGFREGLLSRAKVGELLRLPQSKAFEYAMAVGLL